jgi:NAD(P)-dependent dehydrogenase (short-subunit alcohol dehydrogenase family)
VRDLYAGKTAIVTGGTQGLGEAVARALVREGARGVTVVGRDRARGEQVAAELRAAGAEALFVRADLRDPGDCVAVVSAAVQRFDRVDGLVNAAGTTARGTLEETTPALFDEIMAVNVRAPLLLMQAVVRDMRRRGEGGAVLNVLSMSAHGGQPYLAAYSASKAALGALTKNVAHAHRFDRIRVNGLNLGWTDTPNEHVVQREVHGRPADWLDEVSGALPMGRLADPSEVADLVAFLLSDRCGVMTGSLIDYHQEVVGAED